MGAVGGSRDGAGWQGISVPETTGAGLRAESDVRSETQLGYAPRPLLEQGTGEGESLVPRTSARDLLTTTRVAEVMLRTPRLIRESDPLFKARRLLEERGAALLVVDDQGRLVAIITRTDLRERKDRENGRRLTVGDVAVRNLVTARPDESLYTAVRRMSRLGLRQLPVIDADLPSPPLGMLRRSDVLAVYERDGVASSERSSLQAPVVPILAGELEASDDYEDDDHEDDEP